MSSARVRNARRAAALLAATLALTAAAFGRQGGGRAQASDGMTVFTGRYSNHRFGFGFLIPRGLRATGPPDGYPQDGVVINLPAVGGGVAEIRVYGHYDVAFAGSARAQAEAELGYAREDAPAVKLLDRRVTRIGRFPAVRFSYEFKVKSSPETMICDHVVAFKNGGGEPDTFFHLRLETTRRRYSEDRKTFERVLRSWRAVPLL